MMVQTYRAERRQAAAPSRFGCPWHYRRSERATIHLDVAAVSEDFSGLARRLPPPRTPGRGRSPSRSHRSPWIMACAGGHNLRGTDIRRPRLWPGTRNGGPWYGYRRKSTSLDWWDHSGASGPSEDARLGDHHWLRRISWPRGSHSSDRGGFRFGIRKAYSIGPSERDDCWS